MIPRFQSPKSTLGLFVIYKLICFPYFILVSVLLPIVEPLNVTGLNPIVNSTYFSIVNNYDFGSGGNPFLFRDNGLSSLCYLSGFFPEETSDEDNFFFGVVLAFRNGSGMILDHRVIWSPNLGNSVDFGATLELTTEGNLVLRNSTGSLAWSSNPTGKSIAGLNLTETGNLVLFDANKSVVWESFDHSTDVLVPGQKLFPGQKLTSRASNTTNSTQVLYSLSVTQEGASAFIETHPTEPYYQYKFQNDNNRVLEIRNGTIRNNTNGSTYYSEYQILNAILQPVSNQYVQLMPDGHLKVYLYHASSTDGVGWKEFTDAFSTKVCEYPMACGRYGICKYGKQCSCPTLTHGLTSTNYFIPVSEEYPEQGCSAITPITCNASHLHDLIELENVGYFSPRYDIVGTDLTTCKEACLKNCSCKLAVFLQNGDCHLASDVLSLIGNHFSMMRGPNVTAFIKVQLPAKKKSNNHRLLVIISVGGLIILIVIIGATCFMARKKSIAARNQDEDLNLFPGVRTSDNLDHVAGTRFSYDELRISTSNFSMKLGQGGFGSVYEGVLKNGIKVAVKRLHGTGSEEKSFLAEVESIGSIHHVHLARLVGFCVEKLHCFLVYEYMANGSLEKWIYSRGLCLSWACRRKIVQDVARGLAYLHEDCIHKIVHLDVKPQNILLDEDLNAKLSDFGLAKLIDRNQSKALTMVRGTPGYLAPEWLNGVVTEKVDVYSFGIVLLEIVCGRKHFEESESEESQHLLSLLKEKAEEGQLHDLVDTRSNNMRYYLVQAVEMIRLAIWCLQMDRSKRPSMSMVVKFLDGAMEIEENLDYSQLSSLIVRPMELENRVHLVDSPVILDSGLTGPR